MDKVTEEWRLNNERICNPYSSPDVYSCDQIKENVMGVACDKYGGQEKCIQNVDGKTWWKETTWKT
jgi:hypothetical protein